MRIFLSITICALLLAGCGQKTGQADKPAVETETPDNQLLASASGALIKKFGQQLKTELMSAMNEGGPVNAIGVCQVKAPEIARASGNEFWSIKRVTDRNRNPENLASDAEQAIMARFADTLGSRPEFLVEWAEQADKKTYRFYKPIHLAPLCVKCHGGTEEIDAEVAAALMEKYPDDRAVGYAPGDLRGMFVVEVSWPEGKPFADSLIADSQ